MLTRKLLPWVDWVTPNWAELAVLSGLPVGDLAEAELHSIAVTRTFIDLTNDLATIPMQQGPAAPGTGRVTIGWGRHDRLCWPIQAHRAAAAFPSARLHWFERSGHYSWWDEPEAVARLIAETAED